jgi:exonuclease III
MRPNGIRKCLIWNIRGLNTVNHYDAVGELVVAQCPSLVCLQETKKVVISDFDVIQLLGAGFDYVYLPAIHTQGVKGGVLVA